MCLTYFFRLHHRIIIFLSLILFQAFEISEILELTYHETLNHYKHEERLCMMVFESQLEHRKCHNL